MLQQLIDLLDKPNRDINILKPFFNDISIVQQFTDTYGVQFINRLIHFLDYKIYQPQESIIEYGKPVNILYFFMVGLINRITNKKDKVELIETQCIGEEPFLTRQSSKCTYIALKQTLICYIHKEDFYRLVKKKKLAMSLTNTLTQFPFFSNFSLNFLEQIVQRSSSNIYLKNQVVYNFNEEPQFWFIILKGQFEVKYMANDKLQSLILLNEGEYFGEIEILKKNYRYLRIECQSIISEVLEISKQSLFQLIQKNQDFSDILHENTNIRINQYNKMMQSNQSLQEYPFFQLPIKVRHKFSSSHVRIKKQDNLNDIPIQQLKSESVNELKTLLKFRATIIKQEKQQSVASKIQDKNPRLKQFLEKLNKIRNASNEKFKLSSERNTENKKTHRKLLTEISSPRESPIFTIQSKLIQNNQTTIQSTTTQRSKFYKLLFQ